MQDIWIRIGSTMDKETMKFHLLDCLRATRLTMKSSKDMYRARYGRKRKVKVPPVIFATFFLNSAEPNEIQSSNTGIRISTLVRFAKFFGKSGIARGLQNGYRAIMGPKAVLNLGGAKIVVLPLMKKSEEEYWAYTFVEERRCNLLGLEVKGIMMKVNVSELSAWDYVEIDYKRRNMYVKSCYWIWNEKGDLMTESIRVEIDSDK
eukprot:TRINITY_DN18105_c0_g1_i2.p1 TRINITY_DN18105_c0_g1~~TRINITY_DN18105_c0_g1_i2.p1  ORF type:complete len:205 (+),score=20.75 TRINITY_DN18105_c0_g1_i2:410-1024(+)